MILVKGLGWQNTVMNPLQKSFFAPGEDDDGGVGGKVYVAVTLVDLGYLSKSETERQVWLNISDARAALADALARNSAVVKAEDLAMFDRGKIRLAVAEAIYGLAGLRPEQAFGRRQDGTPFRKSEIDPVRAAYKAHANDPSTAMEDMKRAAAELDALVEQQNREGR